MGILRVRSANTPVHPLCRIGLKRHSEDFPPASKQRYGRFDDPLHEFSTLYCGQSKRAALVETLGQLKFDLPTMVRLLQASSEEPIQSPFVTGVWVSNRRLERVRLQSGQRWLDLRSPTVREELTAELAEPLAARNVQHFDESTIVHPDRTVTQLIARRAFELGFRGLVYRSRLNFSLTNWAVFSSAEVRWEDAEDLSLDDPDLKSAAAELGLTLISG